MCGLSVLDIKHFAILQHRVCRKAFVVRHTLPFAARITIVSRKCSVANSVSGFLLFWSRSNSLQSRSGDSDFVISQLHLYCSLIAFQTNELARIFCSLKKESLEDFRAIKQRVWKEPRGDLHNYILYTKKANILYWHAS